MTMDVTIQDRTAVQNHAARSGWRAALPGIVFFALLGAAALAAAVVPQAGWAHLMSLAGIGDQPGNEAGPALSDTEKAELVALTETAAQPPQLTGDDAMRANDALPFSDLPVLAAKPFAIGAVHTAAGKTALQCLTQAVYYEAAFEPIQGRRAVAQVVLNRMRHPAFAKSVCGVVYEGSTRPVCQFSFTCDGSLNRAPAAGAWAASEAVARAALNGYVEASVGQATHYHANYVSPYWAPRLTKLAQIGAHIFYRWPGAWGMPGAFTGRYAGNEFIPAPVLADAETPALSIDEQTRALAEATLPANLVPIRHAENDVGGRMDPTKGWKLSIPDQAETRKSAAALAQKQGTAQEAARIAGGS
jgi:hypothetical protein